MIVVKVELHSAITGQTTELGRMTIINDGTGSNEIGHYDVRTMRKGTKNVPNRIGRVEDHKRLTYSIWTLIAKGLRSLKY